MRREGEREWSWVGRYGEGSLVSWQRYNWLVDVVVVALHVFC